MDFLKETWFFWVVIVVSFFTTVYQIVKKDLKSLKDVIIKALVVMISVIALGIATECVGKYTERFIPDLFSASSSKVIPDKTDANNGEIINSSLVKNETEGTVNSSSTEISSSSDVESDFEIVSEVIETNSSEAVSNTPEEESTDISLPPKAMIDKVPYASLQSAIDDSNCGDVISVVSNIQEDIRIISEKDITIQLNEYTVSNNTDNTFYIEGNVSIIGGCVDSIVNEKAAVVVECGGNAILRECDITRSKEQKGNSYYTIVNRGILVCEKCDIENGSLKQYKDRKSAILNGYTHAGENILDYRNNKEGMKAELKVSDSKIYGGNNAVRNGIYSILNIYNSDLYGFEHAFSNRGEATLEKSMLYGVESVFCDKRETFHQDIAQNLQMKECRCSSENGIFLDDKMLHENGQIYTNVLCDFIPNVSYVDNGDGTYSIIG